MLYLIKAWDIKPKEEYLELIYYLENILDGHIGINLEIINKAQLEYRLQKGILSQETKDDLYKIKLDKYTTTRILCGVSILLDDFKGFEREFEKLTEEEKDEFKEYPIYSLYSQNILPAVAAEMV